MALPLLGGLGEKVGVRGKEAFVNADAPKHSTAVQLAGGSRQMQCDRPR
jgi:hypothetical protein